MLFTVKNTIAPPAAASSCAGHAQSGGLPGIVSALDQPSLQIMFFDRPARRCFSCLAASAVKRQTPAFARHDARSRLQASGYDWTLLPFTLSCRSTHRAFRHLRMRVVLSVQFAGQAVIDVSPACNLKLGILALFKPIYVCPLRSRATVGAAGFTAGLDRGPGISPTVQARVFRRGKSIFRSAASLAPLKPAGQIAFSPWRSKQVIYQPVFGMLYPRPPGNFQRFASARALNRPICGQI